MFSLQDLKNLEAEGKLKGLFKVDNETYHQGPGISKSDLDAFGRSPAHYKAKKRNQFKQTPSMIFGSAFHDFFLEPEVFTARYAVKPQGLNLSTVAGKDFKTINSDKTILSHDDFESIKGMAQSIRNHPTANKFFTEGEPEIACYWTDPLTGLLCKCKPDWLRQSDNLIVDFKTTEDARLEAFERSVWAYKYQVQSAWYSDGVHEATGNKVNNFIFIAMEKDDPYAIKPYDMVDAAMDEAREATRKLLDRFAICKERDEWPAYGVEIEPISIPLWAMNRPVY